MTKLKLSLKNLAKRGLLLNTCILLSLLAGCSSSTQPSFHKEDLEKTIQDKSLKEYKIEVKAKLIGQTLWIYLPVEDLIEKSKKPEKSTEKFKIDDNQGIFSEGLILDKYKIKPVSPQEKLNEYKYNDSAIEKKRQVLNVLQRVTFSLERSKENEPIFYSFVTADIKNGFEIKELIYYLDFKKVLYSYISQTEYQHRVIWELIPDPAIIQDKTGAHLNYRDFTLGEFVAAQIKYRIDLKFQKPEVGKNVDIDKETLKIAVYVIRTYGFKDFNEMELDNALTGNKVILNRKAAWDSVID